MGGTFDHLHNGHKLLLTQALLCSDQKIVCGITTDALLKKKAYAEFIESFSIRKENVIKFCKRINPKIYEGERPRLQIVELADPIGPTGTDPELEALILTREVEKGGKMINDMRISNGLQPLELIYADMIISEFKVEDHLMQSQFSNKTSSTYIR